MIIEERLADGVPREGGVCVVDMNGLMKGVAYCFIVTTNEWGIEIHKIRRDGCTPPATMRN